LKSQFTESDVARIGAAVVLKPGAQGRAWVCGFVERVEDLERGACRGRCVTIRSLLEEKIWAGRPPGILGGRFAHRGGPAQQGGYDYKNKIHDRPEDILSGVIRRGGDQRIQQAASTRFARLAVVTTAG